MSPKEIANNPKSRFGVLPLTERPYIRTEPLISAMQWLTRKFQYEKNKFELTWCLPTLQKTSTSEWMVWITVCHRYRIVRSISTLGDPGESYFAATHLPPHKSGEVIIKCKNLEKCFQTIYNYHCKRLKKPALISNWKSCLQNAQERSLDLLPGIAMTVTSDRRGGEVKKSSKERIGAKNTALGYSIVSVVRWMFTDGWDYRECKKAFESLGIVVSPKTIRTQIAQMKAGKPAGSIAKITAKEAEQLYNALK